MTRRCSMVAAGSNTRQKHKVQLLGRTNFPRVAAHRNRYDHATARRIKPHGLQEMMSYLAFLSRGSWLARLSALGPAR